MDNKKEQTQVIDHPRKDENPVDYMISVHIQNMYATYGVDKVRNTLKELFALEFKQPKKKRAKKAA